MSGGEETPATTLVTPAEGQRVTNKPVITVVALATFANVLGYMDRVCISICAPRFRTELHFDDLQVGYIFGAFSLSYALFQFPWGLWADRREIRSLLAGVIFFWSLFTGLTAVARNFLSMLVVRFLFGVTEAALSPGIGATFSRYVAPHRRSTAFGLFLAGGRIGAMVAPLITTYVILHWGWRSVFYVFASGGLFMLAAWLVGFPRETPDMRRTPQGGSIVRVKFSRSLFSLIAVAAIYTGTWQFYATWFPTYLIRARGFSLQQAAFYASLPFFFGLASASVGGVLGDLMTARFGAHTGRRVVVMTGFLLSAALLYSGAFSSNPVLGSILIALATGAGDLILGTLWAAAVELGGDSAGTLSGLMNGCSNFGAFLSPVLIGWMLTAHTSWPTILALTALCNATAALIWLFFRTTSHPKAA